jgi:hypothetical protein
VRIHPATERLDVKTFYHVLSTIIDGWMDALK